MRVFKGKGLLEFPIETRVLREDDTVMVRVTNNTGYTLQHCWLWRGPRIVPLGSIEDGDEGEGILTVTPDELSRGVQQARWERDLSYEMFKGRESSGSCCDGRSWSAQCKRRSAAIRPGRIM